VAFTSTKAWGVDLGTKVFEALQEIQQFQRNIGYAQRAKPKAFFEGLIYHYTGDEAKAQTAFERRPCSDRATCARKSWRRSSSCAACEILAALGQKEAPSRSKRATELYQKPRRYDGPQSL